MSSSSSFLQLLFPQQAVVHVVVVVVVVVVVAAAATAAVYTLVPAGGWSLTTGTQQEKHKERTFLKRRNKTPSSEDLNKGVKLTNKEALRVCILLLQGLEGPMSLLF